MKLHEHKIQNANIEYDVEEFGPDGECYTLWSFYEYNPSHVRNYLMHKNGKSANVDGYKSIRTANGYTWDAI